MKIRFYAHASFRLEVDGLAVITDPYTPGPHNSGFDSIDEPADVVIMSSATDPFHSDPSHVRGDPTVVNALELPPEKYVLDDRLREIGYGVWEGSTLAEMQAADPVLYAKRLTAKWTMAPEGGETYAEVQHRMRDWYDSVKTDTVAVAHGGTARALMVALGLETPAAPPTS